MLKLHKTIIKKNTMLLNGARKCIEQYPKICRGLRYVSTEIRRGRRNDLDGEKECVLKNKLELLEEEAFLSRPNSKEMKKPSSLEQSRQRAPDNVIRDMKEKLIGAINKYPQETAEYQRVESIAKMLSYANKRTRDLASSKPWNGRENPYEMASRLKPESVKVKKINRIEHNTSGPRRQLNRLNNARENVLDYRLSKHTQIDNEEERKKKEKKEWREMYKERLLGPSVLVSNNFTGVANTIKSLADQKIMEAQRRGEFKNIHRGKPFAKGFTANGAYIDRTEYHLNRIMKRQDVIPPWIEAQGSVQKEIEKFRYELDKRWLLTAVQLIKKQCPNADDVQLLKVARESASNPAFKSKEWEREQKNGNLKFKISKLNDRIRGYNLQAPLSSQRIYLDADKELLQCYNRVNPTLESAMEQYAIKHDNEQSTRKSNSGGLFQSMLRTGHEIPQFTKIPQIKTDSFGTKFLNMFKKQKK